MMNNMNPNQTKVTTTAFAEGEEHVLSAEQAELLFGGGTIFRVQAPGPLKGTWVVVKVNKKSIKISPGQRWVMRSGTRLSDSPAKDRSPKPGRLAGKPDYRYPDVRSARLLSHPPEWGGGRKSRSALGG